MSGGPELPVPSRPTHVYRRRVQFADTDMAGIAHFTSLVRYMEEAEHDYLRSRGLSVYERPDPARNAVSWPRVSVHVDFTQPARFEDELTIAVTIGELKRKVVVWNFAISRDDTPIATGTFTVVCCRLDHDKLRAVEIPSDVLDRMLQP